MAILEHLSEMQKAHGKNRLVMILDGMGVSVIKKLLDENGFFNRNMTDVNNNNTDEQTNQQTHTCYSHTI